MLFVENLFLDSSVLEKKDPLKANGKHLAIVLGLATARFPFVLYDLSRTASTESHLNSTNIQSMSLRLSFWTMGKLDPLCTHIYKKNAHKQ